MKLKYIVTLALSITAALAAGQPQPQTQTQPQTQPQTQTQTQTPSAVSLHVLGVAQDAGYPQAGCFAAHCLSGWQGDKPHLSAVSLGVFDQRNGKRYLFEATPDFPEQYYRFVQSTPSAPPAIDAVFLTHAHIGHYAGLMYLGHEAMGTQGVRVYAMPRMTQFLSENGPWSQLVSFGNITLEPLKNGDTTTIDRLSVTPLLVPHRDEYSETVGFVIEGPNKRVLFIPDIDKWQRWDTDVAELLSTVDYAFLDATFYADGELPGRDMSKIPHPFMRESMDLLKHLPATEREKLWFIHLNHSNPALWDETPESAAVRAAGFNIAREGMVFEL